MFKKYRIIDSVFRFSFYGTELLCSFGRSTECRPRLLRKINLESGAITAEIETKAAQYSFIPCDGGLLLTRDINGFGLIIDDSFQIIDKIPDPLRVISDDFTKDYISVKAFFMDRSFEDTEYGIYSVTRKKLLWVKKGLPVEVYGDKVFADKSYSVYRLDILTGETIWVQDLTDVFPDLSGARGVVTFLGLSDNLLIAGLEAIDKLIALDLQTGALKWEMKSFPALDYLDSEKGVIHSISGGYCKIDAKTGKEIDGFLDWDYFEEVDILSQRNNYAIAGDHLITTDSDKGIIGAFNTVSHRFDWVHREEKISFPAPKPMIYQDPYLLVQDNKWNLHIFKKQ